jgi:hypothetical protein
VQEARSLRGVLIVRSRDGVGGEWSELRWRFSTTARGDFRLSGVDRQEEIAYDAGTGIEKAWAIEGQESFAGERRGLAPGPPDAAPSDWVLSREIGSVVRALLAAADPSVKEVDLEDGKAWVLAAAVSPNLLSDLSGDYMEVTVDQRTGFPMRILESRQGELMRDIRLEELEIDPQLVPAAFSLDLPPGAPMQEESFQRLTLDQVEAVVGYSPLVPDRVPEGFELTEIAAAPLATFTGTEGMNPQSRNVVSLAYRRGFDRFVVSTRAVGQDPSLWSDPLASGEGFVDRPESIELEGGAFAFAKGELLIDPRAVPHLWALGEELVLTVSGDLSREELLGIAESVVPYPD